MTVIIRTQSAHGRMSADEAVRKKKHEKGKEEKAGKKRRKNTENKNDSKTNFRNPRGTF